MKKSISPFLRFSEAIQTQKTSENYVLWLKQFCDYTKFDPNGLSQLKPDELEDLVLEWIVHLKRRAEKGDLSPNSLRPMLAPIQLFCERNRITLDWIELTRIAKGKNDDPSCQKLYSDLIELIN